MIQKKCPGICASVSLQTAEALPLFFPDDITATLKKKKTFLNARFLCDTVQLKGYTFHSHV